MADEMVIEDEAPEEFVCDQCGDSFKTERGLNSHTGQKHKDEPEELEIVAVDDAGDAYIAAPPGGQFGTDGETNFSRVTNPSYEPRADGLVGVGDDYPTQASRGAADDSGG